MKLQFIFISTVLMSTLASAANISVDLNLKPSASIYALKTSKKAGGIKCGNGRNGSEESTKLESTILNASYAEYNIQNIKLANTAVPLHLDETPYNLSVETDIKENSARVAIIETLKEPHHNDRIEGCAKVSIGQKVQSSEIRGSIYYNIHIPENVYLIEVSTSKGASGTSNVFTTSSLMDFSNVVFNKKKLLNGKQRLWVKPNSTVRLGFNLDEFPASNGGSINEEFVLKVNFLNTEKFNLDDDQINTNEFLKTNSLLSRSSKFAKNLVSQSLEKINTMSSHLYKQATKPNPNATTDDERDSMLTAAFLSFQISLEFAKKMSPFCQVKTTTLPFSGEVKEINGFEFASLKFKEAALILQSIPFGAYDDIFDWLKIRQDQGLKYSDIVINEYENYAKLAEQADRDFEFIYYISNKPFARATQPLSQISKTFNTLGLSTKDHADLRKLVKKGHELEQSINGLARDQFMKLSKTNSELVNVDNELRNLAEVKKVRTDIMALLDKGTMFIDPAVFTFDISADNSDQLLKNPEQFQNTQLNLYSYFLKHLSQELNILVNPTHLKEFESFRAAYFNSPEIQEVYNASLNCLPKKSGDQ